MTVPEFDPARSDAVREALSRRVGATAAERRSRFSRWAGRLGFGVAGVLAGAALSGGAWASGWIDRPDLDQPVSSLANAEGVIPGAPVITLLGEPVTRTVEGSATIDLTGHPAEATHIRLRIACLAAGGVGFGFDPTNTPSMTCGTADVGGVGWTDLELPADPILHILADADMRTLVDYEFAIVRPTDWGTNAAGETYGVANDDGNPVLVAVVGIADDGSPVEGYARDSDLTWVGLPEPRNPDEAAEYMEQVARLAEQYPEGYPVPVYESDGVTRIGTFYVSLG